MILLTQIVSLPSMPFITRVDAAWGLCTQGCNTLKAFQILPRLIPSCWFVPVVCARVGRGRRRRRAVFIRDSIIKEDLPNAREALHRPKPRLDECVASVHPSSTAVQWCSPSSLCRHVSRRSELCNWCRTVKSPLSAVWCQRSKKLL